MLKSVWKKWRLAQCVTAVALLFAAVQIVAAPLLHSFPFNGSLNGRTKSMATDGSNVVVALYSESAHTIGSAFFQTNSENVSGSPSRPGVGVPNVAYGATNFLLIWLEDQTNSVDLHGQFSGREAFTVLAGLPAIDLRGLSWDGQSFLVLWTVSSNNVSCVQGQLLDPNGFARGAPMTISSAGANAPECAVAGATNHFVVWMESTGVTNEWHTRARTVSSGGNLAEIVTLSSTPAFSANPVAITRGKDRALVVWNRETGPYPYEDCCSTPCLLVTNYSLMLFGRMLNPSGSVNAAEFQISYAGGNQTNPKAAFDGTDFFVVWTDTRRAPCRSSAIAGTFGQQISRDGELMNVEFSTVSVLTIPESLVFATDRFVLAAYSQGADYLLAPRPSPDFVGMQNFVPMLNGYSQVEFTGAVTHAHAHFLHVSTNLSDWTLVPQVENPGLFPFVPVYVDVITRWVDPFTNNFRPRFYRSIDTRELCVSNLMVLQRVKSVWAFEQRKTIWDQPRDADLFGDGKYLPSKPACPHGGIYYFNDVQTFPSCTLAPFGHELY